MTLDMLKDDLKDIDHEIVIVDNGSTDDSLMLLSTRYSVIGCDHLNVIYNNENEGISVGKNQGIRKCRGDYILLLDADVFPVPNSIPLMVEFLDNNPGRQTIGVYPNKWAKDFARDCEKICKVLFEPKVQEHRACIFYGLYRREVFEKVMLDEGGPFGCQGYGWEDLDFNKQMQAAGINQWVAGINKVNGRYYHNCNSSFRNKGCMTQEEYAKTSKEREGYYREKWKE